MKRYLIFISIITLIISCSLIKHKSGGYYVSKRDNSKIIDTVYISDSILQVLSMDKGVVKSIEIINKSKMTGEFVKSQYITFHDNGVLSKFEMIHGKKIEKQNDYQVVVIQENVFSFSDKGILQKSMFMNDFNIISEYPIRK